LIFFEKTLTTTFINADCSFSPLLMRLTGWLKAGHLPEKVLLSAFSGRLQ